MLSIQQKKYLRSLMTTETLIKSHPVIIIVPADGLAPLGARLSIDTVMTKLYMYIYIKPAFGQ